MAIFGRQNLELSREEAGHVKVQPQSQAKQRTIVFWLITPEK